VLEYGGLFLAAFLAATILPLASEIPLALVVRGSGQVAWPVVVATAGNYLGACTTYALARLAMTRVRRSGRRPSPRALAAMQQYGAPALLLSWVPVIGDAIVVAAGAGGIRLLPFSLWTLAGKAARYAFVAWAALR
jgi:membrane protein YqaA with SNARE-associated domain